MPVLSTGFVTYSRFGAEVISNQAKEIIASPEKKSPEIASEYYRERTDRQLTTSLRVSSH